MAEIDELCAGLPRSMTAILGVQDIKTPTHFWVGVFFANGVEHTTRSSIVGVEHAEKRTEISPNIPAECALPNLS